MLTHLENDINFQSEQELETLNHSGGQIFFPGQPYGQPEQSRHGSLQHEVPIRAAGSGRLVRRAGHDEAGQMIRHRPPDDLDAVTVLDGDPNKQL